ncbi:MAG: helix-turn-helix transcriptional regulator [Clostridia bacterium]|nr:helix-turn-helix transcriptional regulator [Clostridia bacterium]
MEGLEFVEDQLNNVSEFYQNSKFSVDIINLKFDVLYHVGIDNQAIIKWMTNNKEMFSKTRNIKYMNKHIFFTIAVSANKTIGYVVAIVDNVSVENYFLWKALIEFYSKEYVDQISNKKSELFENLFLTKREKEIAELLIEGKKDKVISNKLFISESTVRKHLNSIYNKFNVTNKLEFVCKYYESN